MLVLKSTGKKCFSTLGRMVDRSGDTISRILQPAEAIKQTLQQLAVAFFKNNKQLVLIIDDTLIKKIYSQYIEGSGRFYDTKISRKIMSLKMLCMAVTDGRYTLPIDCDFAWDPEIVADAKTLKKITVQAMILKGLALFCTKKMIVAFDGAFATVDMLVWAQEHQIRIQARIHNNRKVLYKGQAIAIRDIKDLIPKGRHMARTVSVTWHDISLYVTAQRRIDKHGDESIVYQVANYQAKPSEHVATYKKRWPIEKVFRTAKQLLGLQDCASTKLETQLSHVTSVLLAYSYAQIYRKKYGLDTVEDAIRSIRAEKIDPSKIPISRPDEIFAHA
jgi:Transposase DDE domain